MAVRLSLEAGAGVRIPYVTIMQLGDAVHEALKLVGVTPDLVERWTGPNCGCKDRQERLNQLGRWAARVLKGSVTNAERYLKELMR